MGGVSGKYVAQWCFSLLPFLAFYVFLRKPVKRHAILHRRSAVVLVLGDIGRSPRMMYHSQSLAQHDFETFVVGYRGSTPSKTLRSLPHVHFMYLAQWPQFLNKAPRQLFVILGPLKVIFQALVVLHALLIRLPYTPEFIIVQNPPSIPTLALVQLVTRTTQSRLIIDWHNLGYSILAMRLGDGHRFVRIAKWFEQTFGRVAYAHLFVTKAMRNYLVKEWHLQGHCAVLHDRPPAHFHASSPAEAHDLFTSFPAFSPPIPSSPSPAAFFPSFAKPDSTPFTHLASPYTALSTGSLASAASFSPEALPVLREDRPALVVSSTSWTADEDFGILREALRIYEYRAREVNSSGESGPGSASGSGEGERAGAGSKEETRNGQGRLPKLLMLVTGKGDLREQSMREMIDLEEREEWKWVRCRSVWMSAADYPTLLGSADLGVSLHSSSSNLDLPMKIVDMFGCGLPVCALDFPCLNELVKPGVNGVVFSTAQQLAEHFERLLTSFPTNPELEALRSSLKSYLDQPSGHGRSKSKSDWQWGSWDENWERVVHPLVVAVPGPEYVYGRDVDT